MRILCCIKRVPAPGAKINVAADGCSVDAAHLGFTTSPHEECAVEEAVQITERGGGEVTVLTLGSVEAGEQLRYAASVGAHHGVLVASDGSSWDPQRTARALTTAIESLEADSGTFDLILFGNESADSGGFQVGVRVACALGRAIVNGVKGIELLERKGEVEGKGQSEGKGEGEARLRARREIEGGFEVYEFGLPAVLGIKEGINLPRYPTMRGRLASKKLQITTLELDCVAGGQKLRRLHRPAETVSETSILGQGDTGVAAAVDVIEGLGLM